MTPLTGSEVLLWLCGDVLIGYALVHSTAVNTWVKDQEEILQAIKSNDPFSPLIFSQKTTETHNPL